MVLADLSIRRPVLMTMVILAFVVIGLFSYSRLGVDLMPEMDFPYVSVMTVYPGAGPEEIETLLNEPLEEEISGVSGVKNLYSIAQEGVSIIMIEFQLGMDIDISAIDVKDKVDAIRINLPDDIEEPVVQKFEMGAEAIINLSVTGPYSLYELNEFVDKTIEPELGKIPGLANIDVIGEDEREIEVALSIERMKAYNVSTMQVIGALAVENLDLPSGRIDRGRREYNLRMKGEYESIDEIAATQIMTPGGDRVRLDQIAEVKDTFAERRELARFQGKSSIGLDLVKQSDANTVQVGDDVKVSLEKIRMQAPEGVEISIATDRSIFIKDAVKDVFNNLVMGIIFTAFVLYLFLHSWRGTVIAAITMPVSIVSTFTLLFAADFTLNMLSIMGLAVSVGVLIINAIVVLENIERLRSEGMSMKEAASKGTGQIAVAVAAATLTNIVVFTPMAYMQGMIGPIFRQFGLSVAFATIFSLFAAFTLTPMMAARPMKKSVYVFVSLILVGAILAFVGVKTLIIVAVSVTLIVILEKLGVARKFANAWDKGYETLAKDYRTGLKWAINHGWVVFLSVTVLFVFGIFLFRFLGSEFFPKYDERMLEVSVEMPAGSRLEETNRVLHRIEKEMGNYDEVKIVYTALGKSFSGSMGGSQGVQYGVVRVELQPIEAGDYPPTEKVVKDLRARLADVPAAKIVVSQTTQMGGGGSSADLELQLQGKNFELLQQAADKTVEIMRSTGKAVDVKSDWKVGKPEIVIRPNRVNMFDRGTTVQDIAMVLRSQFEGMVATKYREEGDEFDVRVRLREEDRNRVDRIEDLLIPTRSGMIPLKDVADVKTGSGPTVINRKNKQRMITVSANTANASTGELQAAVTKALELQQKPPLQTMQEVLSGKSTTVPLPSPKLPEGVTVYFGGMAEMMAESFSSLFQALFLAVILTFMLLAAILESYRFPFIIMFTLPLALIGVSMALVITGKTISMIALMSMVMLVGIVVNNGILLIDYTAELRRKGAGLQEAVLEACPVRLRPILMSTVATVISMMPLALGFGAAGEMRSPMAIVAIGGLIVSASLTLFVIPVSYVMLERRKK